MQLYCPETLLSREGKVLDSISLRSNPHFESAPPPPPPDHVEGCYAKLLSAAESHLIV